LVAYKNEKKPSAKLLADGFLINDEPGSPLLACAMAPIIDFERRGNGFFRAGQGGCPRLIDSSQFKPNQIP